MREKAGRRYGLQVFVVVSPDDLLTVDAEDLLTCQSEEVVTQTVDEAQDIHIQWRLTIEAVDDALGTTADGTADVRSGRDRSTRGEDEGLDRRYHIVKAVDLTLDTCHGTLGDGGHGVHIVLRGVGSEVATDGEELVL